MKLIPFSRYKIVGHSMEPTFQEGEVVWIYNWFYLFNKPKTGDIVVVRVADKDLLKRISKVDVAGVTVSGDNQADSLDSRRLGEIKFSQLVGKVLIGKV